MEGFERRRGEYTIATDPARLDVDLIHEFLRESYWSPGVTREVVERSIEHSLVFGVYRGREQVGFARVITDRAAIAYLGDVFVVPEHRGHGLSKWLLEAILEHPYLQDLRRFILATKDAHGLYEQFGFRPLGDRAEIFMSIERSPGELYGD
jgi:GNAT superfamily N-acetyltransferase